MKFTSGLVTLALAVAGAAASPAALEERQDTIGLFFIQFFTEPNCGGTMISSQAFVDVNASSNQCQPASVNVRTYPSFRVRQTDGVTRPIHILDNPDCSTNNQAPPLVIQPNVPIFTCFTHPVGGALFVDA